MHLCVKKVPRNSVGKEINMSNPGLRNLVSWWALEEDSGSAVDSHGANHLTRVGVIGNADAKQGKGIYFENINGRYLTLAANSTINFEHEDYSIGCWYKPLGLPGGDYPKPFIHRVNDSGAERTELFFGIPTGTTPRFSFKTRGAVVETNTAIAIGNWYFVVAWHSASENKSYLQVNNGTPVSVTDTVGGGTDHWDARFGRYITSNTHHGLNGILDEMFIYRRALNDDERSWLYNDGAGHTYTDTVLTTENAYQINWW